MKRALAAVCGATLLIISAHRLPAPIVEPEEKATPAAGAKRKEPPPKKQSTGSSVSDSARRFDGTWVFAPKPGIRFTLVIRNANSAQWTAEVTNTLPAKAKSWPFLPAQYARVQSIYFKTMEDSNDLKVEGSNLRINWPPAKLINWSPKTIPSNVLMQTPWIVRNATSYVYTLNGDKLLRMNPGGNATVLIRTK